MGGMKMGELKRYTLTHTTHYMKALHESEEGEYCLFADFEAERKAHEETKAQLEAVEDAFLDYLYARLGSKYEVTPPLYRAIQKSTLRKEQAIQNSKDRNKFQI